MYVALLLLSLIILTIYSSQVQVTKSVTISNPSIEQYYWLYENYDLTLTCPCKNIAIPRETFLTLRPTFHQVCTSSFVDPLWSIGLVSTGLIGNISITDFRVWGGALFMTITSFCQLSTRIISDAQFDFNISSFVTTEMIPQNQLVKQGQSLIDLFISTTENTFISSLQTIRDITHSNALLSGLQTSASSGAHVLNQTNFQAITVVSRFNSSCSCHSDPTCTESSGLFNMSTLNLTYGIPGFFVGCYIIEATLQSNLALLYNQISVDELRERINFDNFTSTPFKTIALNATYDSQYNNTTPIKIMMQKLMTESWYNNVNYSAYYEQCHPIECKYTYIVKYDIVYIVTTIAGLFGGLTTILQLIIPRLVKLLRYIWFTRCRRTRVQPLQKK